MKHPPLTRDQVQKASSACLEWLKNELPEIKTWLQHTPIKTKIIFYVDTTGQPDLDKPVLKANIKRVFQQSTGGRGIGIVVFFDNAYTLGGEKSKIGLI